MDEKYTKQQTPLIITDNHDVVNTKQQRILFSIFLSCTRSQTVIKRKKNIHQL